MSESSAESLKGSEVPPQLKVQDTSRLGVPGWFVSAEEQLGRWGSQIKDNKNQIIIINMLLEKSDSD